MYAEAEKGARKTAKMCFRRGVAAAAQRDPSALVFSTVDEGALRVGSRGQD
jgi:hypothetical protein